jgi:heme-degrading monooxygenase HmoA
VKWSGEDVGGAIPISRRHPPERPIVIVVFKITHRPDMPLADYEQTGTRMVELVSSMPGFLGMDYAATEGGELLVARFESHEALAGWRNQPEHQAAQERGRREFFAHYRIDVCEPVRSYEFQADDAVSSTPA